MNTCDFMEKTAVIGIVIIVVIIAGGLYYLYGGGVIKNITQTTTANIVKSSNTTNNKTSVVLTSTVVTTTQQVNTTQNTTLADCISNAATVQVPEGSFNGGTYAGWNLTGNGFGNVPANITAYNNKSEYYNSPWAGYNGQFFATTYQGGFVISPGNLTSSTFQVTEPYLNFQIISPQNNQLYVEILSNGIPVIRKGFDTYGTSGAPSSTFENETIPLTTLLCKNINIRVVSGVTYTPATKYDIIAVGDFYLSKTPVTK